MAEVRKKVVVVGDGNTGKTCMLIVFKGGCFVERHTPTVAESYVKTMEIDGTKVDVTLIDTAGQEEYDRLRPLTYPETDVVVIVFAIDNPVTLENIRVKWIPEVKHYLPNVPFFLVGNKVELRVDTDRLAELRTNGLQPVSYDEGVHMAKKIGAQQYMECSAKKELLVEEVFSTALKSALATRKNKKSSRCCLL